MPTNNSFRNIMHRVGKIFPTNQQFGQNSIGYMEEERIDRNFVSAWEVITKWMHSMNGNGTNAAQNNGGIAGSLNTAWNKAEADGYDFAYHLITVDGLVSATTKRNFVARWNLVSNNNAYVNYNSHAFYFRGEMGSNNNTQRSSTEGGTTGIAVFRHFTNSNAAPTYRSPAAETPFHMRIWGSNTITSALISRVEHAFVNINGYNFGWSGTGLSFPSSSGKISGFYLASQNDGPPTFWGQVTWWGMRAKGPPQNINQWYNGDFAQHLTPNVSLRSQSFPNRSEFPHGGN